MDELNLSCKISKTNKLKKYSKVKIKCLLQSSIEYLAFWNHHVLVGFKFGFIQKFPATINYS